MGSFFDLRARWRREPGAVAIPAALFLLALVVYSPGLGWGLPGGDETWAADAIRPTAPLAVVYRNFLDAGWNSGWFWFKYPPFHPVLLTAVYLPYLAWLWFVGGLEGFRSDYPFGLADPESALAMLALLGRCVSAWMGAGCVVLAYLCVAPDFGRRAAAATAFTVGLSYPMVFYSQTTNVEVPYLFWTMVALLAAIRLVDGWVAPHWWALLGIGAALAVSTKELAAGAFVGMPIAIVASMANARVAPRRWIVGGLIAAACCAAALALANLAWFNPLGFWRRIGFLTQSLPEEIVLQYAPYYFPIDLGAARGSAAELGQLRLAAARVAESLGWPTLAAAAAGAVVAARRRPRVAAVLAATALAYYLVSVRAMLSLSVRYVLPLTVVASIAAGIALAELVRPGRLRGLRIVVAGLLAAYVFAYGWDVNRMFSGDGRYGAEAWLEANAPAGARIEIYQNRTYLPRFSSRVNVVEVPFDERDADSFRTRRPDFVVLSSAGLSGVTVRYKQDWQEESEVADGFSPAKTSATGVVMSYRKDANAAFLEDLLAEKLGYREAARFVVEPWIERPLIQSLNPEIRIFARDRAADVAS